MLNYQKSLGTRTRVPSSLHILVPQWEKGYKLDIKKINKRTHPDLNKMFFPHLRVPRSALECNRKVLWMIGQGFYIASGKSRGSHEREREEWLRDWWTGFRNCLTIISHDSSFSDQNTDNQQTCWTNSAQSDQSQHFLAYDFWPPNSDDPHQSQRYHLATFSNQQ